MHFEDPRVIETFAALLVAHVAADYVFQTRWMALNKARLAPLAAHVAIVWAASFVAVGCSSVIAVTVLAAVHLAMDLTKARWLGGSGLAYGLDQGVHVLTALTVAAAVPGAWTAGLWAGSEAPAHIGLTCAVVAMGAVYAVRGGLFFAALMPAPRRDGARPADPPPVRRRTLVGGLALFAGMLAVPLVAGLAGVAWLGRYLWLWQREAPPGNRMARQAALLGWVGTTGLGTHILIGGLLGVEAAEAPVYLLP